MRIDPVGVDLRCADGERLMHAALRAGLRWPSICGGAAECGVCYVRVLASAHNLPPIDGKENAALKLSARADSNDVVRLACQLRVTGPMTVFRAGAALPPRPRADQPKQ